MNVKANRRARLFSLDPLENRQLLSLTIDVRVAGGGKTANVSTVGQVVKLEAWAIVKGSNSIGSDDGLQNAFGSFLSSNIGGGAANGTLKATLTAPFNQTASNTGAAKDLDADGDLDIGSNVLDRATGYFFARSDKLTLAGGTISGGTHSFKIADLSFTVTSLKSGTQTDVNFRPRGNLLFPITVTAVWMQDGVRTYTMGNTTQTNAAMGYTAGSPVVIKRGSGGGGTTPGSISGNVFRDANNNGNKDSGETNLASWRVYIDANKNGAFDSASEKNVLTDGNGNYNLSSIAAGSTNRVRVVLAGGYRLISPSVGYHDVFVGSGQNASGNNFAASNTTTPPPTGTNGSIAGNVFKDANGNHVKDSGEAGAGGWRVYVDWNKNGVFDSGSENKFAFTDSAGNYKIADLSPNVSRRIRVVPASGFKITTPSVGYYDVTLSTGQNVTGKNFGAVTGTTPPPTGTNGSISGNVFRDFDGDKFKDAGDWNLANWLVYVDWNKNGIFDAATETKFARTDSAGNYKIADLSPNVARRIRIVPAAGYRITSPTSGYYDITLSAGQNLTGKNFIAMK